MNDLSDSDDESVSVIVKDLVKIVCYPTVFTKRYIKTLVDVIDTKLPKMRDSVVVYGPCTTIKLYTTKTTSLLKILKNIVEWYQLCGLRCGICVISGKTDQEYWVMQVGGPCSDDNDCLYQDTKNTSHINSVYPENPLFI